eukprot:gene5309-8927_t
MEVEAKTSSIDVRYLIDLKTTKDLSNSDYIDMGIKLLVFHLDNYDCKTCQLLHQKLNKMNSNFEAQGYILLLYYERKDQDVFDIFRSEFNNQIDYFFVDKTTNLFLEGCKCKSTFFEIHENYLVNIYTHEELENSFSKILEELQVEEFVEDIKQNNSISSSVSSPVEMSFNINLSPLLNVERKSDSSDLKKVPSFFKRISNNILSPRGQKSPETPDSLPDISEIEEDYQFVKEFENNPDIILQNNHVKDTLEMGLRLVVFHMDNLKCPNCLEFHNSLNHNMDFLLGEMITPLLNYSRSDQNTFQLLNDFTKNNIEILNLSDISEEGLKTFERCEASIIIVLDHSNFVHLKHENISMNSIAKSCSFDFENSKKLEILQKKVDENDNRKSSKRMISFKSLFKKNSSQKLISVLEEPTNDETTPKFIMQNKTLDDVLKDDKLRTNYFNYLKKECAEENLIFYEHVQKYKSLGWTDRKTHAREMIKLFFDSEGKFELNTTEKLKKIVSEQVIFGKKDLFDEILKNTLRMLNFDVLKRFLGTQGF